MGNVGGVDFDKDDAAEVAGLATVMRAHLSAEEREQFDADLRR